MPSTLYLQLGALEVVPPVAILLVSRLSYTDFVDAHSTPSGKEAVDFLLRFFGVAIKQWSERNYGRGVGECFDDILSRGV